MRKNLPVTQREYLIGADETLLSTTDLKGRITYANEAFVRASGFEAAELYGSPHNIVRHPDMPPPAFEDMWRTLRTGRAWTALVKNRRKDGDHYWVRANATPIRRGGEVAGYLSVRTPAPPDEVRRHEELYRLLAGGAARLWRGFVIRRGAGGWLDRVRFMPVPVRLALGVGGVAMAAAMWVGVAGMQGAAPGWGLAMVAGTALVLACGCT